MDDELRCVASIYRDGTYQRHNPTWHVEDSKWKAEQIAAILLRNDLDPASLAEVGCGAGEILRQLAQRFRNARFTGYEISPQAFRLCAERAMQRVAFRQKDLLDDDEVFDCLLCIDVFEHVEDYLGFLKALRMRAAYKVFHIPLDMSALAVLRGDMLEERASVGHLHYFSRDTALATLRDCGYRIVDCCYTANFRRWPTETLAAHLRRAVRRLLYAASPDFTVRLCGGCSLLVLTK